MCVEKERQCGNECSFSHILPQRGVSLHCLRRAKYLMANCHDRRLGVSATLWDFRGYTIGICLTICSLDRLSKLYRSIATRLVPLRVCPHVLGFGNMSCLYHDVGRI